MLLTTKINDDRGSIPAALLAAIVVAGLVTVLTTRTVAGERSVRFDESFNDAFHVAEVGTQQAVFQMNAGLTAGMAIGATTPPTTTTVDGADVTWEITRTKPNEYEVVSSGEVNGVARTLKQVITEEPVFFPGAFGDRLIGFNGTSTRVDSYNSACTTASTGTCGWGSDALYGTGNGSIGTNGDFDFSGNPEIRPSGAFLYDWADNPGAGMSATAPFGDRCNGASRCTPTYVSTIDEKLDFSSDAQMQFIQNALAGCTAAQQKGAWTIKNLTIAPFNGGSPVGMDPTEGGFRNYYCADSLNITGDLTLHSSATRDKPVVIFVRDYVSISGPQVKVNCGNCNKNINSPGEHKAQEPSKYIRPVAPALMIFVASQNPGGGAGGNDVFYKSGTLFGGVMYAPRAACGGNGNATIYGAIICGNMDNVGGWAFHYDDSLSGFGSGIFNVSVVSEEPGLNP